MQSLSKLVSPSAKGNILSIWKKNSFNIESIKEEIDYENEKEFEINNFNNNIIYNNMYYNNDYNKYNNTIKSSQMKESLGNKNLLLTFGEGGNHLVII